jgi:L-malate glycosyltransferase
MANIIELCLSSNCGGLEIYVERISRGLVQRGHRVQVVTSPGSYLAQRLPAETNHPLTARGIGAPLRFGAEIVRKIVGERTDAVHVHGGRELPYAVLAKLRSRRPLRLTYTRHNPMGRTKKDLWHRALYRHVDAYLTVSEEIRRQALPRVPVAAERIHVLQQGVDSIAMEPDQKVNTRARLGLPRHCFLVGAFSRIEYEKGQHTLIDAIGLLRQRGVDVQAFIMAHVAEPAYYEGLRHRVRQLGVEDSVTFRDFMPDAYRLMVACDAITLTSKVEGSPLTAFEAMGAGVPLVGSRCIGGAVSLIEQEETGLLFDWEDAAALADHLEALYRDPELRARLARNGYELVRRRFSTEAHMDALEAHLLGSSPRHGPSKASLQDA